MSEVLVLLERINRKTAKLQKIEDLRHIEAALSKKMTASFRRQGKLFVGALSKYRGKFVEAIGPDDIDKAWKKTTDQTADGMTASVQEAGDKGWKVGAERAVTDLSLATSFTLKNPRAVAYMEAHAAERVAGIDEVTRRYIKTLMTKAVDEGWSYSRTASVLIARFEQFAVGSPLAHIQSRAELIAVTESAFAYEAANASVVAGLMEQGLPMEKAWLTVGDDRVDEEQCGPNEDEGWIAAEGDFQDGSSEPPAHPGCRCTALYQVSEDFLGPLPDEPVADPPIVTPGPA